MESFRCSCGTYTTNEDGICDICRYDPESKDDDSFD